MVEIILSVFAIGDNRAIPARLVPSMDLIDAISLDDLRLYAAVVRHGGFSAAARATGIPKSRLSRRIDGLEERLGVRLLQRSTRRFVVTELGAALHRHSEAMLAEAEAAIEAVARATSEPRGRLRVACPIAVASSMLAPVLPEFLQRHPQVQLELEVANRRVDVLAEGFDAALRVRQQPSGEDGLVMRRFADLAEVLVAAPEWLARHPPLSRPEDLAEHCLMSYLPGGEERLICLQSDAGSRIEVAVRPRVTCAEFQVLLECALAGLGIAHVPRSVASAAIASGQLEIVLPEWRLPLGIFHVVFPHRRGLLPAVRAFIDFLVERMPGITGVKGTGDAAHP
jgi:DNA-binding transcriptional LysR family regulator